MHFNKPQGNPVSSYRRKQALKSYSTDPLSTGELQLAIIFPRIIQSHGPILVTKCHIGIAVILVPTMAAAVFRSTALRANNGAYGPLATPLASMGQPISKACVY